ncbi:MAG: endonuclease/exonuclease/phosphatase family protein [Terrimicrobiaceae bacterium]|nr:endonuclease/exonuclease/phosphatase family protein [Terrimicrobiaceae bacterium]
MRILRILLVLAAAVLPLRASAAESAAEPIEFISWNIEWYPGKQRFAKNEAAEAHAVVVRSELAKLAPDILLAQEIRDWEAFAGLCAAVPGLRPAVVSAFPHEETGEYWGQQLAIGSRLPLVAAWSEMWKPAEIHPRRGFSAVAIALGGGRVLLAYSVHLKSNRSNSEEETRLNFRTRDESIRQLIAHVSDMENLLFKGRVAGVVIGGDFNTNGDGQFGDRVVELLREAGFHHAWEGVPREKRLTWVGNDRFEPTTFDHFFTKGLGRPTAEIVQIPEAASDHLPVRLLVQPPASPTE